jgi:hypothetical protein
MLSVFRATRSHLRDLSSEVSAPSESSCGTLKAILIVALCTSCGVQQGAEASSTSDDEKAMDGADGMHRDAGVSVTTREAQAAGVDATSEGVTTSEATAVGETGNTWTTDAPCQIATDVGTQIGGWLCYPTAVPNGSCGTAPRCSFCAFQPCTGQQPPPRRFYSCRCEGTWTCSLVAQDTAICVSTDAEAN